MGLNYVNKNQYADMCDHCSLRKISEITTAMFHNRGLCALSSGCVRVQAHFVYQTTKKSLNRSTRKTCLSLTSSATRTWYMLKVVRSNIQIAITPPRFVRLRSNFVQFDHGTGGHYKCSRSKVKGQGHGVKVQGHSVT